MSKRTKPVPVEEPRRYLKAKPLSKNIGVCAKSLFRWADAGLISRRKINARTVLFDVAECEKFIESCRVTTASA